VFFVLGVLTGGLIAWNSQRKRRRLRERRAEAALWQARSEEESQSRAAAFLPRPERS
jgi:hypothetical protein